MLTDPLGAMFAPFELAEELPVEVTPSTKTFIWDELMTTDAQSALAFYGELFGWESRRVELPDGSDYFLLATNGSEFADVAQFAQLLGRPGWLSYIGVDDVDAIVAEALQLGASIVVEPMELRMSAGSRSSPTRRAHSSASARCRRSSGNALGQEPPCTTPARCRCSRMCSRVPRPAHSAS